MHRPASTLYKGGVEADKPQGANYKFKIGIRISDDCATKKATGRLTSTNSKI